MRVVLASHNEKKLIELRRIIGPLIPQIELIGYDGPEPTENGTSFEANALIKARAAAGHTGLPAIADDSGITVDVLGGSPGIFSARWSGPEKNDEANLKLLLWQLRDMAPEHRAGAFVCAAALVTPEGGEVTRVGRWPGMILQEAQGEHGFGYDPVFQPEGEERSAAQLTPAEKDRDSHRTRAFTQLVSDLNALTSARVDRV